MDPSEQNIIDYLRNQLDLPPHKFEDTDLGNLYGSLDAALPLRPDHIFAEGGRLYVIDVKRSVTIDAIARMLLYRQILQKKPNLPPVQLVLAAKTINSREENLAQDLGIRFIKIPWAFGTIRGQDYKPAKIRIASTKSWKIVSRLLKEKSTSIRQLALREKISYGWAHKVIEILSEQDVVKKEDGYVTIANVDNLLNGVAWERPLKNLQVEEIFLRFEGAHGAAQEITRSLKREDIPFAFNSYTAGGLYTGYAFRQDAVYLYMEKKQIDEFGEQFGGSNASGVRAVLYSPDREVFSDARELESVVVTSPSQTLLDLAGLGYSAMDLTKAMAEKYAGL